MAKLNIRKKQNTQQTVLSSRFVSVITVTGILATLSMTLITTAFAADLYDLKTPPAPIVNSTEEDSYRINFRYREESGVSQRLYTKDEIMGVKSFSDSGLKTENSLEQYNATIYYALGNDDDGFLSKHQWLSIDLGVNFKFIEQTYESTQNEQNSYRTHYGAYPMFSASALFDLPLSGMTASLVGNYYNHNTRELSEYRAKLTYQVDNIFGVSGGWVQEQYLLSPSESLRFDKEGPFVDLFYRF